MPTGDVVYLTVSDVADRVQVTPQTVLRWLRTGGLPASDIGTAARHNYRVKLADLERWMDSRKPHTPFIERRRAQA